MKLNLGNEKFNWWMLFDSGLSSYSAHSSFVPSVRPKVEEFLLNTRKSEKLNCVFPCLLWFNAIWNVTYIDKKPYLSSTLCQLEIIDYLHPVELAARTGIVQYMDNYWT